jgi:hypothetical protein
MISLSDIINDNIIHIFFKELKIKLIKIKILKINFDRNNILNLKLKIKISKK